MVEKYAEEEFLDFIIDKLFPANVDCFPGSDLKFGEVIDYMRNGDSAWHDTYKLWRDAFDGEFQKYKADPENYAHPHQ